MQSKDLMIVLTLMLGIGIPVPYQVVPDLLEEQPVVIEEVVPTVAEPKPVEEKPVPSPEPIYRDICGIGMPGQYVQTMYASGYGCDVLRTTAYIIYKESTWNQNAKNPRSTASGLAQFLDSSWPICQKRGHMNKYNATDQIRCTMQLVAEGYAYDQWFKWW